MAWCLEIVNFISYKGFTTELVVKKLYLAKRLILGEP